jgi:8-oxo-dGTP pyrophosphatase MutT (NUDIX family)
MRQASRAIVVKDNQLLVMQRNKFGHEYCALIGGSIDPGESPEQTLYREVQEETTVSIANHRLVIIEDAGEMYGIQYIYLCDYVGGEPQLALDSPEAEITALGKNLYQPAWLPLDQLETANLLPKELKQAVIDGLKNGFPEQPIKLTIQD